MLLEFSVTNFLSFNQTQTLKTEAMQAYKEHPNSLAEFRGHYYSKCFLLTGPNASGKSNFIQSLKFVQKLLLQSPTLVYNEPIDVTGFMQNHQEPSCFQLIFVKNNCKYNYAFSCTQEQILEESLYSYENGRQTLIFKRENTNEFTFNRSLTTWRKFGKFIKDNRLFLAMAFEWDLEELMPAAQWISEDLVFDLNVPMDEEVLFRKLHDDAEFKKFTLDFLHKCDIHIINLDIVLHDSFDEIHYPTCSVHTIHAEEGQYLMIPYEQESLGIRRMFSLANLLYDCRWHNKCLLIEELDRNLHSLCLKFFISIYTQQASDSLSQLFFTTYDTHLLQLKLLRRDQIYFMEKDKTGASILTSLAKYPIRSTDNIQKAYWEGRLNGLPNIDLADANLKRND